MEHRLLSAPRSRCALSLSLSLPALRHSSCWGRICSCCASRIIPAIVCLIYARYIPKPLGVMLCTYFLFSTLSRYIRLQDISLIRARKTRVGRRVRHGGKHVVRVSNQWLCAVRRSAAYYGAYPASYVGYGRSFEGTRKMMTGALSR